MTRLFTRQDGEAVKSCPHCHVMIGIATKVCPGCGQQLTKDRVYRGWTMVKRGRRDWVADRPTSNDIMDYRHPRRIVMLGGGEPTRFALEAAIDEHMEKELNYVP